MRYKYTVTKEIGEDSTKWNAYVTSYNKVKSDNLKP